MSEIEVEIDTNENKSNENNNENNSDKNNNENKSNENIIIEKKPINKLTKQEKDIIVNNARNNIENDYYDVVFYKNGNYRIVAKKLNKDKDNNKTLTNKKVFLSNDQFLIEHIIDLNTKVERLRNKQKKLKRKYKTMKYDIYEQSDENENIPNENIPNENIPNENTYEQTDVNDNSVNETISNKNMYIKPQRGWRSYITSL